ncbi:MAG: FAD-dependent oxidoreductase [Deltaproteobacteria bacterium]|nr:FAD-dependent oxidoreductase [Deltaproteobacteria bacterium]
MGSRNQIVVIGGVAAGMKTASRIMRLNPFAKVIVLEKTKDVSYGACSLPYYIEGHFDDLEEVRRTPVGVLRDEKFFANCKGVEVRTLTEALEIDSKQKKVKVRNLENDQESEIPYDKLVLATGNHPILPPIPGMELPGVYPLKTMADAENILSRSKNCKKAVIIGGGLIGLEVAEALVHNGLQVSLIEMKNQVLNNALDFGMASLVHRELKKNGVNLCLSQPLERIEARNGKVCAVKTPEGVVDAEMVVVAIGVKPVVALAQKAGLKLGETGAIAVDDHLCTSDPDIYAAGDCVESQHLLSKEKLYVPLGSTANKHGRVVANNICGRAEKFPGILSTLVVKVFNQNGARTGLLPEQAQAAGFDPVSVLIASPDKVHNYPDCKPIDIKLVADKKSRKVIGAQIVGPGDVSKRIDTVVAGISMGITVDQMAQLDLAYAPPFSAAMDPLHIAANALRNKLDGIMESLDPQELRVKQLNGDDFVFLDVRSPKEYEEVRIPGATLIPLGVLRSRVNELPKDKEIIPFCKLSLRGYEAALILKGAGFENVRYMEGGVLGWPYELETS